jgi:peptidyl-Asp metalloendopeptidase
MNGFTRTSEALVYTEGNTAWSIIADADFNGDGVSDLLWRNSSTGQVYLMPFSASGFPNGGGFIYTEANSAWKIAFTPDLDGDGKADLLWWNSSTGQVFGMLWNGSAFTTQGFIYTEPNTAWRIEAVGDFSGTGKQNQLLWRNTSTGMVWFMTVNVSGGGFTQSGQFLYNSTPPYQIIAAADFNGDGKDDILWRQPSTGAIYLMLMNGAAITFEGQIYQEANTAWKVVSTGDYNGDGKADLLWRNDSTGQVYMMLMSGAAISSQAMVYQEPNTAWKILGPWEYRIP